MNDTNSCRKCKMVLNLNSFPKSKEMKNGFRNTCKECTRKQNIIWKKDKSDYMKEYSKNWHIRNKEKMKIYREYYRIKNSERIKMVVANSHLKRKYGLSLESRKVLLETQNNSCAICKVILSLEDENKKKVAIDHCHKKNRVRGILCMHCNSGLGFFKDDIQVMQNAIDYIKRHQ